MKKESSGSLPQLYQYNVCPFCWKVKALLNYKKLPYQSIEVHPLNKKEIKFSAEYKKVPIFIDGSGKQINDSTPIMKYIDAAYPDRPVFETTGPEKEVEEKWLNWADAILVRALPPLIYRNISDSLVAFDYITHVEKFNWLQQRSIKYSGAVVMTLVAKKSAKSQGITDPQLHLKKCLQDWAQALGKKDFLGGNKPNGADLAVFGILKSVQELPAFRFIEEQPTVSRWYQRIDEVALRAA